MADLEQISLYDASTGKNTILHVLKAVSLRMQKDPFYATKVYREHLNNLSKVAASQQVFIDSELETDVIHTDNTGAVSLTSTIGDVLPNMDEEPANNKSFLHWTNSETLCLIQVIKEHYEELSTRVKKNVWVTIAKAVSAITSTVVTWGQCDTKWKGLKKTYKNVKDHNAKSGNDKRTWEYFERMDDVIGQKPEISPVAVCSTSRGLVMRSINVSSTAESSSSMPSDDEFESSFCAKRRKLNQRNGSAVEQRHKEKMERQVKFFHFLKSSWTKCKMMKINISIFHFHSIPFPTEIVFVSYFGSKLSK